MAGNWFACSDGDTSAWVKRYVQALAPGARVTHVDSGRSLRKAVYAAPEPTPCIIYDPVDVETVNLGAAIVSDGNAGEVVLVVDEDSGSLRSRAARAGISRVVTRSEAEAALRDARANARTFSAPAEADDLDEPAERAPQAPPRFEAPVITLVSGRGGVGKSSIAALMALAAASWGMRVALVDYDLSFGNLYGFFGLQGPADLTPLAADPSVACALGRKVAENVTLFGSCARPEFAETVPPHIVEMLQAVCKEHDLVVVDSASAWGEGVARAAQLSDRLLITADERAGALGSLTRSGALAVRLGVARTRIVRLMNRCDARRRDGDFLARADMGLETARSLRVLDGGTDVAELLSSGHAAELAKSDSPFALSCATCVARILSELGALPDNEAARRARDMKEFKPRGLSIFRGAV